MKVKEEHATTHLPKVLGSAIRNRRGEASKQLVPLLIDRREPDRRYARKRSDGVGCSLNMRTLPHKQCGMEWKCPAPRREVAQLASFSATSPSLASELSDIPRHATARVCVGAHSHESTTRPLDTDPCY